MKRSLLVLAFASCAPVVPPIIGDAPIVAGKDSLVRVDDAPECDNGGARVRVGTDVDGDGALSDAEVDDESIVCSGADGVAALSRVMRIVDASAAECAGGGVAVEVALDTNENAIFDDTDQSISRSPLCSALPEELLVRVVPVPPCVSVEVGPDANRDGLLDSVSISESVCDGAAGETGVDGDDAPELLWDAVGAGAACENGGSAVRVGLDVDGDGALDVPAEVDASVTVCNGRDGSAGAGDGPGAGVSEGAPAAPVDVDMIASVADARDSTVAATGTSFYRATTSAEAAMPHSILLFGVDGAVTLNASDANGAAIPLTCALDLEALACATDARPAASDVFFSVTDVGNRAHGFALMFTAGADESLPLVDAHDAALRAGGRNLYRFDVLRARPHTITVSSSAARVDGVSIALFAGEARPDRLVRACRSPCVTPPLVPTTSLVIVASLDDGVLGGPATVSVDDVDVVTPDLALDATTTNTADIVRFTPTTTGDYVIRGTLNGWALYLDRVDAQNDAGLFFSCGGRGCEVPLEGGVTYYLRAPAAQVFGVVLGVGPEGTAFAPIAVPIDADVVMRWDEDEVNSFYAFTPQTYGPHTLRFSGVLPTRGQLEITQDVGATRRLVGRVFFRDTVEVIDDVLAGVPVLINVAPDDGAHAFHMRVEEGDTVAQVVPLDGTPTAITLPAGASINGEVPVQIFSDRVQPIRINFFNPSGPMRREVRSRASSPLERSCETFFRNDEECSLEIPGRFGTAYATILDLENVGASLTMSAVPVAPSELTVDVPVTNEVMPRGGSHWYHFVADSERRAHTITLRFVDRSATFTIRHSDADVLQFTTQTFTGGAGSVHTLQIPNAAGLTPGEHLVHVFPSSSQVGDVIYDFEVEKTP